MTYSTLYPTIKTQDGEQQYTVLLLVIAISSKVHKFTVGIMFFCIFKTSGTQ